MVEKEKLLQKPQLQEVEEELAYLEADLIEDSGVWIGLKARLARTGGRDSELRRAAETAGSLVDNHLEKYYGLLALRGTVDGKPA